jgi:hypothetical protein
MENKGDENNPRWATKGGSAYKYRMPTNEFTIEEVNAIIDHLTNLINYSNPFSEEYVIHACCEDDDYLSWFERSQLDYRFEWECAGDCFSFETELDIDGNKTRRIVGTDGHLYVNGKLVEENFDFSELKAAWEKQTQPEEKEDPYEQYYPN